MGVRFGRHTPDQRVLRKVSSGTIYRAHLQRVQEIEVQFTLEDGEDPEQVAWELAAGGWETTHTQVISMIEIRDREKK